MMWHGVEARQELAKQKMAMARTVKNCQAMLVSYQTQLSSAQVRL